MAARSLASSHAGVVGFTTMLKRSVVVRGIELKCSYERETASAAADPLGISGGLDAPKLERQVRIAVYCASVLCPEITASYAVSPS